MRCISKFHSEIERQLRLEACLDTLLAKDMDALSAPNPTAQPWRNGPALTDTAQHFGYAVLGRSSPAMTDG
jgi:hypothetical protein